MKIFKAFIETDLIAIKKMTGIEIIILIVTALISPFVPVVSKIGLLFHYPEAFIKSYYIFCTILGPALISTSLFGQSLLMEKKDRMSVFLYSQNLNKLTYTISKMVIPLIPGIIISIVDILEYKLFINSIEISAVKLMVYVIFGIVISSLFVLILSNFFAEKSYPYMSLAGIFCGLGLIFVTTYNFMESNFIFFTVLFAITIILFFINCLILQKRESKVHFGNL